MKAVIALSLGVMLLLVRLNALAVDEPQKPSTTGAVVEDKLCVSTPASPQPPASATKKERYSSFLQPSSLNVTCTNSNVPTQLPVYGSTGVESKSPPKTDISAWFVVVRDIKWPLTILLLLLFFSFFLGRETIRSLFLNLRGIRGGGFSIEFDAEGAKKALAVSGTFGDFIKATNKAYSKHATTYQVKELMEAVVKSMLPYKKDTRREYRATVHVPDVVYDDYTYQLLDYFPSGGGVGRRFSQRRGILGKTWRLDKSIGAGDVIDFDRPNSALVEGSDSDQVLVSEWSMTNEELENWRQRKRLSYVCVVLRLPYKNTSKIAEQPVLGRKVGVLYVDSLIENAFGDNSSALSWARILEHSPEVLALAEAVESVMLEMRKNELNLKI